jgi:hypothetical protein
MDRLHHVEHTLRKNIEDNLTYPDLEFVILDYNSKDGLDRFIKENFKDHIESGLLSYYRTFEPDYFHRSHSRNLALRLATGDIVCNVDADNYLGKDFAYFINHKYGDDAEKFLTPGGKNKNVFGRLCIPRKVFSSVTGYDETMSDYGFEDFDMVNRLLLSGLKREFIEDSTFLSAIEHDDFQRLKNEKHCKNLRSILVKYISYSSSQLLFLFNNNTYATGTIIDNFSCAATNKYVELSDEKPEYEFSLAESNWQEGGWQMHNDRIELSSADYHQRLWYENGCYSDGVQKFYEINLKSNLVEEGIFFYSQVKNRLKMQSNLKNKAVAINKEFGIGTVYKNFDFQHSIKLD